MPFYHVILRGQRPLPAAYPKELKTLGDQLRKRWLDLGLLQRDVARELGVSVATITNWELHHTMPAQRLESRISRFLDVFHSTGCDMVRQAARHIT